jgi:hypothetical protein
MSKNINQRTPISKRGINAITVVPKRSKTPEKRESGHKKTASDHTTMASRTLLLLRRRHALLASVVSRCAFQRKRPAVRTLASSSKPAIIIGAERIHDDREYSSFAFVALAAAAAAAFVNSKKDATECGAAATAWDPQSIHSDTRQPRNVMLHRMRSIRARNLEDKYKVDWSSVMGEGAYGSVYPARLATTGEKVSQSWWH